MLYIFLFFFFKQKTAYEMRISDWSSDVCSSDLYRPTLPLTPLDLYMLIEDRARAGIAKSSIDRLVASMVRLHKLLELPSPVDENLRWKQKEIRKFDTRQKGQALGLRLKGDVADIHTDPPDRKSTRLNSSH